MRLVGERRDSVAISVGDMNSGKPEVTSSNVWEFSTEVAKVVHPSGGIDGSGIDEVVDNATEVVAHKVALVADLEEIRRSITSKSEVVAIGGDGCFIVSTCGTSSFCGVDNEVRLTSTGECGSTRKRQAEKGS